MASEMTHRADWAFLQAAVPDLRDYILSQEIYWPLRPARGVASGVRLPQLTIGNLLLSQARLAARSLPEPEEEGLAEAARQIHALRQEWLSNWSRKAAREFESRANLWQQYIRELRADPRRNISTYANEVRNRSILRLLRSETGDQLLPVVEEQLGGLDAILRGISRPGPFVWEPELQAGFPPDGFWFLYVSFPPEGSL